MLSTFNVLRSPDELFRVVPRRQSLLSSTPVVRSGRCRQTATSSRSVLRLPSTSEPLRGQCLGFRWKLAQAMLVASGRYAEKCPIFSVFVGIYDVFLCGVPLTSRVPAHRLNFKRNWFLRHDSAPTVPGRYGSTAEVHDSSKAVV